MQLDGSDDGEELCWILWLQLKFLLTDISILIPFFLCCLENQDVVRPTRLLEI